MRHHDLPPELEQECIEATAALGQWLVTHYEQTKPNATMVMFALAVQLGRMLAASSMSMNLSLASTKGMFKLITKTIWIELEEARKQIN